MTINPDIAEPTTVDSVDFVRAESKVALTPSQLIWRRFRKHRMALLGGIGTILLLVFILIGSFLVPEKSANVGDLLVRLSPPMAGHPLGTDSTGRDVFNRIIYGGQISLFIGILAVILEVSLGTVIGATAAYFGGWVDTLLMRFTEAMLAIPSLFLLIVLAKFLGRNIPTIKFLGRNFSGSIGIVILVIGLTSWMYLAVAATLGLANAILTEAYVSFLGLGVQPPTATWGNMMQQAQSFIIRGAWWMWVFPSLFIIFTILCINLMGDGLRDAFDPRSTRHL